MDTIIDRIKERQARRAAEYVLLVDRLARDERIDGAFADGVLLAAGKTLADLEADIKRAKRRDELQAEVDKLPSLREDRARVLAAIQEADDKLHDATEMHSQKVRPLQSQLREIERDIVRARGAENALDDRPRPQYRDPALVEWDNPSFLK